MLRPNKQQIDAITKNGDLAKVVQNLSAAYFLVNVAVGLYMDSQELLRTNGLVLGESKREASRLQTSFDNYINSFGKMVRDSGNDLTFAKDYDDLRPAVLRVLGFKEENIMNI